MRTCSHGCNCPCTGESPSCVDLLERRREQERVNALDRSAGRSQVGVQAAIDDFGKETRKEIRRADFVSNTVRPRAEGKYGADMHPHRISTAP